MLPIFLLLGLGHTGHADEAIIPYGTEPTMGPEMDTVYQAGTSGGPWSEEEVASTRQRVLQMVHPDWDVKEEMYQLDKSDSTKVITIYVIHLQVFFYREKYPRMFFSAWSSTTACATLMGQEGVTAALIGTVLAIRCLTLTMGMTCTTLNPLMKLTTMGLIRLLRSWS